MTDEFYFQTINLTYATRNTEKPAERIPNQGSVTSIPN
jgi:hypothetical protein